MTAFGIPSAGRAMTMEELVRLIHRFLAPPWISVGVSVRESLLRTRQATGFGAAGSLWIATGSRRVFPGLAIPLGWIPERSIVEGQFDEDARRWTGGEIRRGWRSILAALWQKGYLRRNDPELLRLLGRTAPPTSGVIT